MKSIQRAHIVAVADNDFGLVLVARLRRMELARVTAVAGLDEASRLCQASGADACIVPIDDIAPDAKPIAESDAPGRSSGVPSLMVVPVVTPYLRKMARRCGYLAAVPASIPARMLYRRIGAALQERRAARRRCWRMQAGIARRPAFAVTEFGKPTVH